MRTYSPGESFSPEFTELSIDRPEALEFALIHGAAKLARILSDKTVGTFYSIGEASFQFMTTEDLFAVAPELIPVLEIFGTTPDKPYDSRIRLSSTGQPGIVFDRPEDTSHQDDDEVGKGVSLLIPTRGPQAYFGAVEEEFDIFQDGSEGPDHLWCYGLGDIMLVRQDIDIINGKEVNLERAWHGGVGALSRCLSVVDIAHPEMQLGFDTADLLASIPCYAR